MTNADWQALLDRDPGDAGLRLQYSDWLEEQGRAGAEAEVQRWLARTGKRPNATPVDWEWWREGAEQTGVAHRGLPDILFRRLPTATRCDYQTYSTRASAEEALVAAWRRLEAAGGRLP